MAKCSSCGADIVWAVTKTGKLSPISMVVTGDGNIVLELSSDPRDPPIARVLKKGESTNLPRRISHFVDCPTANKHREAKR